MATLRHPPLLLTKRLTSFLHLNLSPQLTTLLLLTPDGRLLAYASQPPIPVATLRTHGTVAASLYAIHSNGTDPDTLDGALPPGSWEFTATRRRRRDSSNAASTGSAPLAVTIQLESGVVLVIRKLKCGMLFVCMGPPTGESASRPGTQHQQQQQQQQQQHAANHHHHNPAGGNDAAANGHSLSSSPPQSQTLQPHTLGSPPETASIRSAATGVTAQTTTSSVIFGAGTVGVMATRRLAEELARWLDDKLGTLEVPDDGLGGYV
ncbi:hypothetical protein VPNG_09736 [Cytospora leucostoma]|uniref:Uncharacterized protein n=1 Tax=Cytospora leucostoma TaxID=1230097 RepID=A0A423VKN9_9PEZI|nr:hypothetical protein VPNG_09736 [Cytospora leucostoma]